MRIDFVRHGKPDDDKGTGCIYSHRAHLSEIGRQQAKALGDEYRRRGIVFDTVYSSPLPRARETAKYLPRKKKRIRIRRDLSEPKLGELVGTRFADLPQSPNGKGVMLYGLKRRGQEDFSHVVKRTYKVLRRIVKKTKHTETIAIVAHGPIGKIAFGYLRDPNGQKPLSEFDLRDGDQLGNAQANALTIDTSGKVLQEERIQGY